MGTFPLSLVLKSTLGTQAQCAWAPELVFTLGESARILGVKRRAIDQVRVRFPEVKIPPKVCDGLSHTFGSTLTPFGEITIALDSPGGPQEHICLTHYSLFRHAVYIRTPEARRIVLHYPEFILAIKSGRFKSPAKVAARYRYIFSAPYRHQSARVRYVAAECGKNRSTIWNHLAKITMGQVDRFGMPVIMKPGPPKGYWLERLSKITSQ